MSSTSGPAKSNVSTGYVKKRKRTDREASATALSVEGSARARRSSRGRSAGRRLGRRRGGRRRGRSSRRRGRGGLALQGQEARAVREKVVARVRARVAALVEELEVAGVDGEGLVRVRTDDVAVADVVRPGRARVGLAGERLGLGRRLRSPGAAEAGRGERAEEAAVGTLGLDDHEVLVLALNGVDLDGFEEVAGAVGHDDRAGRSEAAGEVADGHASAVDLAVVTSEEEVHVRAVADERLVDRACARAGDRAGEQSLRSAPPVRVRWVRGRLVAERGRPPLVRKHPHALLLCAEERGRDG
jgi:hypothetical protein